MTSNANTCHRELILRADAFAAEKAEEAARDPHRLGYHIMAPSGWINDPNGLVYFQDEYHVFYQFHPYSSEWGPMHWGHVKSKDLVHWERLPTALAPSEPYDQNGCFSGSAVDDGGVLTLVYTGNIHTEQKQAQVQCIAVSTDGIHFAKPAENPVIGSPPGSSSRDFRDPKVWKHGELWYMVVGYRDREVGRALLYKSRDLRDWEYIGPLCENDGRFGHMWECPDFFPLGDKYVLVMSPMGMAGHKNIYLVGDFDYTTCTFKWQHYGDLDYGYHFYAAQTMAAPNGRRILFGWMNMWGREQISADKGWSGALTIPRELQLLSDGTLSILPAAELKALRQEHVSLENLHVHGEAGSQLGDLAGDQMEIIAEFDLAGCNASVLGLRVRCSADGKQETRILYHRDDGELVVDLERSGAGEGGCTRAPLRLAKDKPLRLHIYLDRSSVEVFGNEGRVVLSNRIYPDPSSQGIELFAEGGSAKLRRLDAWKLKSIW